MKRILALTAALLIIVACDTEVQLEPAPQGILRAGDCPPPTYNNGNGTVTFDWGSAGGRANTFSYDVNDGYSVTFCLRHGSEASSLGPVTGSGSVTANGLNHWSVTDFVPPETTTEPTAISPPESTTTTAAGTTTTVEEVTTITQGAATTSSGATSTSPPDESTTTEATTTTAAGATTVTEGGGDESTTTADPGATTVTQGGGDDEGGDLTTTTEGDVAGGSDETLPRTGRGNMSLLGLAGMALMGGFFLLALARRRPDSD